METSTEYSVSTAQGRQIHLDDMLMMLQKSKIGGKGAVL